MKSVSVQWDIFIAHMLQGKGGGSREERILSLSFVLPPSEDYWYWRFSGASTEDEPLTHIGSCDTQHRAIVGKISNLAWIFFFFFKTNFLLQSMLLSLLLCAVSPPTRGSTVSPMVCWEAFHPVSPANMGLCDCACLRLSTNLVWRASLSA